MIGALDILNAYCGAIVVTEIEFRQIAVQVLLGTMLIDAAHSALENREVAFDRIGGCDVFRNVLANVVLHSAVLRKLFADPMVEIFA